MGITLTSQYQEFTVTIINGPRVLVLHGSKESKKQAKIATDTFAFNEYLVVATSLGSDYMADEILDLYRYVGSNATLIGWPLASRCVAAGPAPCSRSAAH